MVKVFFWGCVVGLILVLGLVSFSLAFRLLTAAEDWAVVMGAGLLMGSVALAGGAVVWAVRKAFPKHSDTISRRINDVRKGAGGAGLILLLLLSGSGCTKVEPGYVGIKVNMYGSQKGVEDFPQVTGRAWYNPFTTDVFKFPTFIQTIVWTKDKHEGSSNDDSITFNSVEGAVVNVDIGLAYAFVDDAVPRLFVEFRRSAEHITSNYMRSQVRDSFSRFASTMKVVDIFGGQKQALLDRVKRDLTDRLGPKGFTFDMVSFIGALRVDDRVEKSINAVIEATQRAIEAENKVRQSTAEADQKIETARGTAESILIEARAQADANEIVARSVTPSLIEWQRTQRWDGTLPLVTGAGAIPMIDLRGER